MKKAARAIRDYFVDKTVAAPLIAAVILAAAGIAAALITSGGGSGTPTSSTPTSAGGSSLTSGHGLTIQDSVYGGAWAVTSPTLRHLSPRERRPASARRWYLNGTSVQISCAQTGAPYPVILNQRPERWHWWAQLRTNGLWVPMAQFQQTQVDGSQGYPTCRA